MPDRNHPALFNRSLSSIISRNFEIVSALNSGSGSTCSRSARTRSISSSEAAPRLSSRARNSALCRNRSCSEVDRTRYPETAWAVTAFTRY